MSQKRHVVLSHQTDSFLSLHSSIILRAAGGAAASHGLMGPEISTEPLQEKGIRCLEPGAVEALSLGLRVVSANRLFLLNSAQCLTFSGHQRPWSVGRERRVAYRPGLELKQVWKCQGAKKE